jgi:hypothetical protein
MNGCAQFIDQTHVAAVAIYNAALDRSSPTGREPEPHFELLEIGDGQFSMVPKKESAA